MAFRAICLTFLLGLVACDDAATPEGACDNLEVCDWLGGSCLDTLTQLESDAAAARCDEEMDAYLSCLVEVDTNVCEDPEYDAVFCPHDLGPLLTCMGEA